MTRRSSTYLWQSVIGFGFLSGIWTALGLDPEEVILNTVGTVVTAAYPDESIRVLFILLPMALLILSIYMAYTKGRVLGLCAVLIAYLAGLAILVSLVTTFVLLAFALVTGYIATKRRLVRKITGR